MYLFLNIFLLVNVERVCSIWMPELNISSNFDQYQLYRSQYLDDVLYSSINSSIPSDFQWQSVVSVSLSINKISYIVYGGSQHTESSSKSAFPKKFSIIVICQLSFTDTNKIFAAKCSPIHTNDTNRYLGVSLEALSMSDKTAVIVYCDPLWFLENKYHQYPSGKCYLSFIDDGVFTRNTSIEFCKLPCLAGFSVDLVRTYNRLSELQMVVGMPYVTPFGKVEIIDDPFGLKRVTNPRNGIGKYFNFGYAVSSISTSTIYASSPLDNDHGSNVTDIRQDTILMSPDNVPFGSFGQSLKTLVIGGGHSHAVVIGAPFHPVKSMTNVGKVYIFCVTNNNSRSWLSAQLYGEKTDEYFGFSLANIGDINGDGNEDLAIGSPFIRDDDGRGFVSIYTVSSTCTVNIKPQQILRNSQPIKVGIFGLSITGRYDLDFNGWPDIVILSSRSNSIHLYASRRRLKAECKFSLINNFENEPLKINEHIPIKIFVSLLDVIKGSFVNLNFLTHFDIVFQIDPNVNTVESRFKLNAGSLKHSVLNGSIAINFTITSLMKVNKMNLSTPIIVGFRLIENCPGNSTCDNLNFPLIDWELCKLRLPVTKYICANSAICSADLSVNLTDQKGTEVIYGYDKSFSRTLTLMVFNFGPTVGKDVNFKVSVHQNLRIHKITSKIPLKSVINQNQTEAVVEFDQEEIDMSSSFNQYVSVNIEIYFNNFNDLLTMKFYNNSIVVDLFSEVHDSNKSNNRATIYYTFRYAPNITISGSPSKETIIDQRNGTILIRHGNRLALDKLGPLLTHRYIVDNAGDATVINMTVKVNIPIRTEDGYFLLYLFEEIRQRNGSMFYWRSIAPRISVGSKYYQCKLSKQAVNPLEIIGFETNQLYFENIYTRQVSDWSHKISRRSVIDPMTEQIPSSDDKVNEPQGKMYRIPIEIIRCDRKSANLKGPMCAEIVCHVPLLPPHNQARLQVNAWLWAHTFFKKQIADIIVHTNVQVDFTEIPSGVKLNWDRKKSYSVSQHFIFPNFKTKIRHFRPWWPIILGIVVGINMLVMLMVAMYKCGFFQRNRVKDRLQTVTTKRSTYYPVIVHPDEMHTSSSMDSDTRVASHSTLIK